MKIFSWRNVSIIIGIIAWLPICWNGEILFSLVSLCLTGFIWYLISAAVPFFIWYFANKELKRAELTWKIFLVLNCLLIIGTLWDNYLLNKSDTPITLNSNRADAHNMSIKQIDTNCYRDVNVGDIGICLPEIVGMSECYFSNLDVKRNVDYSKQQNTKILGVYLKKSHDLNRIYKIGLGEMIQVYVGPQRNKRFTEKALNTMRSIADTMELPFEKSQKKVLDAMQRITSYPRPVKIENYSPHENAFSQVNLMKYVIDNKEVIFIRIHNTMKIKSRAVYSIYDAFYDDDNSLDRMKKTNDLIVRNLLLKNNSLK